MMTHYYRVLQVQPDAPADVIRHNYRTLLKKLRMHPDLGGNQEEAILLNLAYETLSHPDKRAAYDRWLFKRYDMATLSLGDLKYRALFRSAATRPNGTNRRNYYRLLQIQPNAHAIVILERYLASLAESDVPHPLLHAAYAVLGNPGRRAEYDRLLRRYPHVLAIEKMRAVKREPCKSVEVIPDCDGYPRTVSGPARPEGVIHRPAPEGPGDSRCCIFCKAPHAIGRRDYDAVCPVCRSPLFAAGEDVPGKTRRTLARRKGSETIRLYGSWPGPEAVGCLRDFSPQGLCFDAGVEFGPGQVVKIDGERFKAVGEVLHCRKQGGTIRYGVRFRTVRFTPGKGHFLTAKG